jgi:hypothetical protein
MKKPFDAKLSLRKLMLAMLAAGPVAILPSPVWAVLPTAGTYSVGSKPTNASFDVTNGTVTVANASTVSNLSASDRAVLVWGANTTGSTLSVAGPAFSATATDTVTNFNIESGQTYNFIVPSGGSVLNRVKAGNVTATGNATYGNVAAFIGGSLLSNGKVFILSDSGNISVANGATINTAGGLVLSTLAEGSDGPFTTLGDLTYTGASNGNISIGTATVSGNLTAWAGAITSYGGGTVSGDLVLRSITSGQAITLASGGALTVTGNLAVTTNAGAIGQGANAVVVGSSAVGTQTANFTTNGNVAVTLDQAGNDFQVVNLSVGTTTANDSADVTLADANIIRLGTSTVGGDLVVTAAGASATSSTAIGTTGTLTIGEDAQFNTTNDNSSVNIGNNSTVGGTLSGTITNNASFTYSGLGNLTTGAISATNGTSGGNRTSVSVTTTGNLTVAGAITALGSTASDGGSITLTGAAITQNTGSSITAGNATRGGSVTMNATAGNLTVGNIDASRDLTLRSTGTISQVAATSITTRQASRTVSINATGNVTLDNANAIAATAVTQITTGGTANLTNSAALILGTSNVTGNLNLTGSGSSAITLGTGVGTAAQNITVGGVLSANGGAITDGDYSSFNVFGGLNLTGTSVDLNAAIANGSLAPRVQFGQVNANVGAGTARITETTTLNLGNITAATLTAQSTAGGIVDSGNITVTTATLTANSTGSIVLDNTNNSIGTLNVAGGSENSVLLNSSVTLGSTTSVTGNLALTTTGTGSNVTLAGPGVTGNLVVNAGGTIDVTAATTITGNLSLASNSTSATSIGDSTGSLTVSGTTTLASAGGIDLDSSANDFNIVTFNGVAGAVEVVDANNLTVTGNTTGVVTATAGAGSIANTWNLTFGNVNVGGLEATAGNGGGGNSGTITQLTGTSIHSEATANFTTTNNNIVIGNNGNSFGRVGLVVNSPDRNNTVTLVEDGTLRLGNLNTRGNTTLTSRFGSIIEDAAVNVVVTNNGTLTLNSAAGSILLGGTSRTAGTTSGNVVTVVASAPTGAVAVRSDQNLTLGNITAQSLTAASGNNLAQSANTTLSIFGASTFTATNNITLTNNTNNFGRVSLTTTTASRNISITEAGTLNLGTVTMPGTSTGNFTATSLNGDIIDSGLGGVRPGGTIVGTTVNAGTTVVTLVAANGNIVLDDPTTDFVTNGGIVFNANNVTLSPLGQAPLVLGAANSTATAGNLTVTSAVGSITQAGNISVTNDAVFQTGTGNITLTQAGNRFGTVRFTGNQVRITQANDINIVRGSQATGLAEFVSGSYITIDPTKGSGIVTFGSTANFTAASSITLPKLLQAVGTITVNAAGTKDLGALSVSADLNGRTPVNLGTGSYVAPQP